MYFRIIAIFSLLILLAALPGCMIVDVGVTNPVPGLSKVAVAPFINLSHERAVDGHRFALAYYAELQKVPGFEVVPVGVTEAVIVDNKLHLNRPDDVLKLARMLDVDAVVVGAITDYAPYYPPRIGYQIEWYSPHPVAFYPGIQTEPQTREQFKDWDEEQVREWRRRQKEKDRERAHEHHIWRRTWWGIKRLPGVRKLAGEPTIVDNSTRSSTIIRAQSMEELPRVMTNQEADLSSRVWQPENARIGWIERPADTIRAENSPNGNPFRTVTTRRLIEPIPLASRLTSPDEDESAITLPYDLEETPEIEPVPYGPPASNLPPSPTGIPVQPSSPGIVPDETPAPQMPETPAVEPKRQLPEQPVVPVQPGTAPAEIPLPILPVRDPNLAPLPPQPNPYNVVQPVQPWQLDPRLPFMSYTRIFDGSDADLVAALRDYVELSGDLRSGGWEAYLHRSEDFIRFTSHMVISEMLSLHGGEGRHRIVIKNRKYK